MDTEYTAYVIKGDLLESEKKKSTVSSGLMSQQDFVFCFICLLFVCFKVEKVDR